MEIKYIVCEDNPSVMEFYKTLFKSKKINDDKIAYFYNGKGAIELLQNLTNTDIFLLTDFHMPKANGGEVLTCAISKNIPYKILRTSMDLDQASRILDEKYNIQNGVTLISKQESLKKLKEEIKEYQENFEV